MSDTAIEESEQIAKKAGISFSRNHFYFLFIFFCTLPIFSFYLLKGWGFLTFGFINLLGNFLVFHFFEKRMKNSVGKLVKSKVEKLISPSHEKEIEKLKQSHAEEMNHKMEEMREAYLEFEEIKKEKARLIAEREELKNSSFIALEKKEGLLNEYQQTMYEQRMIIEKNKKYIFKLEAKVNDLMYEIRSLLRLEESNENTPLLNMEKEEKMLAYVPREKTVSIYDLSTILKRYVEMAENFKGVGHLGIQQKFANISFDNFTIDLRHFFESFKEENIGIVFLFSVSENKMIYANHHVKNLLGVSVDRFIKDFSQLILGGQSDWKKSLGKIGSTDEEKCRLLFKGKNKEEIILQSIFSMIRKGPFAGYVLGLLSETNTKSKK